MADANNPSRYYAPDDGILLDISMLDGEIKKASYAPPVSESTFSKKEMGFSLQRINDLICILSFGSMDKVSQHYQ